MPTPSPPIQANEPASRWSFLAPFQRVTSGGRLIPQIDGLRFFAIFAVLLFHVNGYHRDKVAIPTGLPFAQDPLYRLFELGNIGVQLFFVLSGFILALPFARHALLGGNPVPLRAYFLRRLTRLEPPYITNLLLLFLMQVAFTGGALAALPHLAASLVYLHSAVFGTWSTINFVAWSLEVEVQFYLLAPWLAWLFRLRPTWLRRLAMVGVGIAAALWQQGVHGADFPHGLHLLDQLQFFLMGFLLADLYLTRDPRWGTPRLRWDLLALLGWLGLAGALLYARESARFTTPVAIGVICLAAFRGRFWRGITSHPLLTTLGGMCYTIYLYHAYLILGLMALTGAVGTGAPYWARVLIQAGLILPPTLGSCGLLFVLLERPFMHRDWPSRLRRRLVAVVGRMAG